MLQARDVHGIIANLMKDGTRSFYLKKKEKKKEVSATIRVVNLRTNGGDVVAEFTEFN